MTDITITPANVTEDTAYEVDSKKAGADIAPGDAVFVDGDNQLYLATAANANSPGQGENFGLSVSTAKTGQWGTFLGRNGDIIDLGNDVLEKGKWYALSQTPGKIKLANEVVASVNEVQRLEVSGATTGDFTIGFDGEGPSDAVGHAGTAADVKSAMESLPNIDLVSCTGGPLGSAPIDIEYQGDNAATDVPEITVTNNTDGAVTPSTVTAGVSGDHPRLVGFARSTRKLELFLKRVDEQA